MKTLTNIKKRSIVLTLAVVAVAAISGFTMINSKHANGSEVAMTNSPHDGSGSCNGCHSGGSATPTITFTATPAFTNNTYVPGTQYTLSYKVSGYTKFGFDLELNGGNTTSAMGAGTNVALTNCKITANPYNQGYPANVSQTAAISSSSSATWHWTAPSSGTVYMYSVGLGVNNNGSTSGDKMAQYNLVLTPASTGTPPVANFTAANTNVCAGQSIAFTDQSTNTPTSWSWSFTGGTPSTSTSQNPAVVYNTPGTYTVALTATNGFGSNTKTLTNYITVNAIPSTPSANSNSPVCSGGAINLTTPTVSGATYSWTGPSSFTSSTQNPTRSNATSAMAGTYSLTTTVNGCTSSAGTTTVVVNGSSVTPSVAIAITGGGNPTCNGQSVTFTASPTNGGSTPSYQWKLNGSNVGSNSATYSNSSLTNGSIVTCVMTSNSSCASPSTATSNAITMAVTTSVAPQVAVSITSGSNPTCTGQPVTFTATATNGGSTPIFQWKLNGVNTGTNSSSFNTSSSNNGDIITCFMTSSSSCASPTTATSNGITMAVGSSVSPTLSTSITSGSNPTCSGQPVTFTATQTNGGSTPSYQWQINGVAVGTNTTNYTSSYLANGDIVSCVLTASSGCANPNTVTATDITMQVDSSAPATVNITGASSICAGQALTLTANAVNGGATPSYQWKLNGSFWGTGDQTCVNPTPVNGDVITCIMTSSSSCANPTVAISNLVTVTINNGPPPTPTITANDVTLTSSSATGNQWFLNGVEISGATDQTYVATENGSYQVIVSNGCALASSDAVSVTTVGINELTDVNELSIFPNPNNGNFTVSFSATERANYELRITSVIGQVVFKEALQNFTGPYSKQLSVNDYGKGIYTISLLNSKKGILKKIIVY